MCPGCFRGSFARLNSEVFSVRSYIEGFPFLPLPPLCAKPRVAALSCCHPFASSGQKTDVLCLTPQAGVTSFLSASVRSPSLPTDPCPLFPVQLPTTSSCPCLRPSLHQKGQLLCEVLGRGRKDEGQIRCGHCLQETSLYRSTPCHPFPLPAPILAP